MKKCIFLSIICAVNLNIFASQNRTMTVYNQEKQQLMLSVFMVAAIATPTVCTMVACNNGYCKWENNKYSTRKKRRGSVKGGKVFINGKSLSGHKYSQNHR